MEPHVIHQYRRESEMHNKILCHEVRFILFLSGKIVIK